MPEPNRCIIKGKIKIEGAGEKGENGIKNGVNRLFLAVSMLAGKCLMEVGNDRNSQYLPLLETI